MDPILIIGLVLLAGFGGVFYVLPSKKQRKLSKCRLQARSSGLVVAAVSIPKYDSLPEERVSAGGRRRKPKVLCCSYSLPNYSKDPVVPTWQIRRSTNSVVPIVGWEFADGLPIYVQLSDSQYWLQVGEIIEKLPEYCLALTSESESIAWIGQEKVRDLEGFIEQMKAGLNEIARLNDQHKPSETAE